MQTNFASKDSLKVGTQKCSKFALLDDNPVPDAMFISYFLQNVVVG